MIMPFTASDEDGPASPSRRRALADCAGLVATTCFASWNRCAAATGTPKGELFAFKAPGGRDLVFALALAQNPADNPSATRLQYGCTPVPHPGR